MSFGELIEKKGMESLRELYRIGRGPSSSHTMGPEKACLKIKEEYKTADNFEVVLFGSLAKTGIGHRTDYAIEKTLGDGQVKINFNTEKTDIPHPNTMEIAAFKGEKELCRKTVISVGGGAIEFFGETKNQAEIIYKESTLSKIEQVCERENISIPQYVKNNEGEEIFDYLNLVWQRMKKTIDNGLNADGIIPGGLEIKRKAKKLLDLGKAKAFGHEKAIYLLSSYAYAASEENASGETMVTAPTCGASGAVPAVLRFKQEELGFSDEEIINALAVAGIIGNVVKTNASISGAECGCQAEIGTSCAMAAAAFAYLKGLSVKQIECAAEIALEHHLGLTCDPVKGLVQIPCIERNAVAAMRAVDAVSLAEMLFSDRKISFDLVVKTMYETGKDLSCRYRETSEGGLAKLYENK